MTDQIQSVQCKYLQVQKYVLGHISAQDKICLPKINLEVYTV